MAITLEPEHLDVARLLIDPNNPRFFDLDDWGGCVDEALFADPEVQSTALERTKSLKSGGTSELEESIRANGFIPAEQIVVKPVSCGGEDYHVVVEGNRRLSAIKSLLAEPVLTQEDKDRKVALSRVWVLVYQPTGDAAEDAKNEKILQGMRHVSGPKEWGAYQKGDLVVSLHDDYGMDFASIDARIGLGPRVTKRYYHAYKALQQMKRDSDWAASWTPGLWRLFEEALAKPTLRDWLGWDEVTHSFTDQQHRELFYELITSEDDDSEPRISSPEQMRKLRKLMDARSPYLEQFLSENIDSIDIAYAKYEAEIAQADVDLADSARRFQGVVETIPAIILKELPDEDVTALKGVVTAIDAIISMRASLRGEGV